MKVLVLRTINKNLETYGGFTYPEKGFVRAPDWNNRPECGGGLHGLLWGHGSFGIPAGDVLFQLIEVDDSKLIEFDGKCKFKEGDVIFTGTQEQSISQIKLHPNYPKDNTLNFDIQVTTESNKIMQSGYMSTQMAGYRSTQTAGYMSTQTAGDGSTQTAGDRSIQTAGDGSTQTAGYRSTQTAGYRSTQTAGYMSTQTAGYMSTQTAGINSIQIGYWYDINGNYQVKSRKVTKLMADKPYKFEQGKWTLVTPVN